MERGGRGLEEEEEDEEEVDEEEEVGRRPFMTVFGILCSN